MKKNFVSSDELKTLLFAKRDGNITSEQNERLGVIANHIANIALHVPSVRRFLQYEDADGFKDLENQMRAQILIVILGTCPYKYEEDAGRAYSYCLYCANSEVYNVIKKTNWRKKIFGVIDDAYNVLFDTMLPATSGNRIPCIEELLYGV